jgi:hypothetical protein
MIIRGASGPGLEIDDEDLLGVDLITYGDLVKFVDRIALKRARNKMDRGDGPPAEGARRRLSLVQFLFDFPITTPDRPRARTTSLIRKASTSCRSSRCR